jgi:threonine dehydrogenase-like Zn-dependent dehydrogenase
VNTVEFDALEYTKEASFQKASYRYEGDARTGWTVLREGRDHLTLPRGYRLLRSIRCGVCSTDLARHHLPYPLPQITGHEVIAEDDAGRTVAAEINASHHATGSPLAKDCPFCRLGLPTHCPDRLTLGIDRLPGGFAPWILVPENNVVAVPAEVNAEASVLIEPFAAALHAAEQTDLAGLGRVAVLGAGRLGLLIVAALRGRRETIGGSFSIEAIDRNPERLRVAEALGADRVWDDAQTVHAGPKGGPPFAVVFESTGSPEGLEVALELASREVHLKSTTGLASLGLEHATELVVDEVSLGPFGGAGGVPRLSPSETTGTALICGPNLPAEMLEAVEEAGYRALRASTDEDLRAVSDSVRCGDSEQAALAVVETVGTADRVLRPWPDREQGLIRPRGTILVADTGQNRDGLLSPILERGIRIGTSRCGEFRRALPVMQTLLEMGIDLGRIVTGTLPAAELPQAFEQARSPGNIKVVVTHSCAT